MPFNYGWVVLFAGFCMHLCIGGLLLGQHDDVRHVIFAPDRPEPHVRRHALGLHERRPAAGGLHVPGRQVAAAHRPAADGALGSTLVVGAYLFGSLATTLAPFLLCYGALFGLGTGLVYTCPTTAAVQWLPHRKGLVNGVVVMGFGLGAFCFNFFITAWCNPDHLAEDVVGPDGGRYYSAASGVPGRVPGLLRTMAAAFAVVLALGSLLIRPPPQTAPAPLLGDEGAPATPAAAPPPGSGLDAGPSKPPVAQRAAAANADIVLARRLAAAGGGDRWRRQHRRGADVPGGAVGARVVAAIPASSARGWAAPTSSRRTKRSASSRRAALYPRHTTPLSSSSPRVTPHLASHLTALTLDPRRGTPTSTSPSSDR